MSSKSKIEVTAIGFDYNMQPYPRRIEFDGAVYHFIGLGKQTVIAGNTHPTKFYRMTDGTRDYHLKNEAGRWTLLGVY